MLRNLKNKIETLMLLAAQAVTADIASAVVDLKGNRNFAFLVSVGSFAFTSGNKIAMKIQESDDGVTFADAPVTAYYEGAVTELVAGTDADKIHCIQYRGSKQYVKMMLDVTGTVSAPIAIVGLSTELEAFPA